MVQLKEIEVYFGKGIAGTLAIPPTANEPEYNDDLEPASHKVALILHGQGGHRNYCYQKLLAHRLAKEMGIYSLRIDFRGCGSSADNANPEIGRVLDQDIDDIQSLVEFLMDGQQNPVGLNFTVSSIISHSRGSVAMFLWALKQDELIKNGDSTHAIVVPNLINCSSRFQSVTVLDRYPKDGFDQLPQTMLRHGKFQPVMIMNAEITSLSTPDLGKLNRLSLDFSVLSIYGLEDQIIPVVDSAHFANALNRGHLSHHLELIPMADHNFYGTVPIENAGDAEDYNPDNLPLTSSKLVNFSSVVVDKIKEFLKPENELSRFLQVSKNIGHLSRWKNIEGVSNFRDIGGWKLTSPRFPIKDPTPSQYYVVHNLMYRCANMGSITDNGLTTLQKLGIRTIFDLRSEGECIRDGYASHLENYGIKRIHAPVFVNDDYSPQAIAVRYANLMTSWNTYVHVYDDMLGLGVTAFKTIFEYIRDINQPFIFHCTAGKDRTGMISMLILLLAGLDHHTIAKEYELTTIGLKPDHDKIKTNFLKVVNKMKQKLDGESLNFEVLITKGRKNFTIEHDGFNNLISSRYEAMLSTIELFNDKYGGIINYMTEYLKFNQDDILKIYNNIVINDKIGYFNGESFIQWSHKNSIGPNL